MMYEHNNIHRHQSLSIGKQYEEFIVDYFIRAYDYRIEVYQTYAEQVMYGESKQGIEIKYDARSLGDCTHYHNTPTYNVAIEVFEKTSPGQVRWIPSGILRPDNTKYYLIGNYIKAWFFAKPVLLDVYASGKYKVVTTLPTMQCMLIPVQDADILARNTFEFK
jgi:hypothetical protein